jgi:hypothetical protein
MWVVTVKNMKGYLVTSGVFSSLRDAEEWGARWYTGYYVVDIKRSVA